MVAAAAPPDPAYRSGPAFGGGPAPCPEVRSDIWRSAPPPPESTGHWIADTVHRPPFTVHRSPFTVHRSPFTVHRSPFTVHRPPSTVHRPPSTVHRLQSTVHSLPSTVHSPISTVYRSPLATRRYKYFIKTYLHRTDYFSFIPCLMWLASARAVVTSALAT